MAEYCILAAFNTPTAFIIAFAWSESAAGGFLDIGEERIVRH